MPFTSGLVSSAVIFSVGSDASVTFALVGMEVCALASG
jgi:hypothetical protein